MWALPELVEAASRTGRIEEACSAFSRLVEVTQPAGTDWALGTQARSRALLSHGDPAEQLYQEAIERFGRTSLLPELARAQLLYGEWLRRDGRRIDARRQLRAAREIFAATGMRAFTDRADGELAATGEAVRSRTPEARDDLTAQEQQIALLACDGHSNAEIGARLFLSPRTVEWHLRKVYAKVGITSRRDLARALPQLARQSV
jgi:DNA-binding CsgD family transcriptional regulator